LLSETKRSFVAAIEKAHSVEPRRFLVARLRNRADLPDLVQEIYLRVLRLKDHEAIRNPQAYLGDPVKNRAVYDTSSPLTYLNQVKAPLLALQGDMDIRVPKYEAEQVVATLKKLGRTVDGKY
jgi:DNA-directed RNA polymerase specialized sigma24 family protein